MSYSNHIQVKISVIQNNKSETFLFCCRSVYPPCSLQYGPLALRTGLDLQLGLDGLPESLTFRQTVINLTKDIWANHLRVKIMTFVWGWGTETRHHINCSAGGGT